MKRRDFIALLSATAMCPLAARAQQRTARLCVLAPDAQTSSWVSRYQAFIEGLRELGYEVGGNVTVNFLSADGNVERFPALAEECVRYQPDIIIAYTTPGSLAAKKATSTIPIVFGPIGDPVATGIVPNLARPGGNITGLTIMAPELSSKRLQLLKEAVPALDKVAVLAHLVDPIAAIQVSEMEQAAKPMGLRLQIENVRTTDELPGAFEAAKKGGAQGLLITIETFFIIRRARIVELAAKHRLPAMYPSRDWPDAGGLMGYGPNILGLYRQSAAQVDKILKGAKPAGLPVEQPVKFEFVVNLKTAKALGIVVPPMLLARADEVIE